MSQTWAELHPLLDVVPLVLGFVQLVLGFAPLVIGFVPLAEGLLVFVLVLVPMSMFRRSAPQAPLQSLHQPLLVEAMICPPEDQLHAHQLPPK